MNRVQRAPLAVRLHFVNSTNMYVCLISFVFYVVHTLGHMAYINHAILNKMAIGEYMATCPLMQLSLAVLGGPACKDKHRGEVVFFTVLVLAFGFAATLL